jgi:thiamine-monophosphate kinase
MVGVNERQFIDLLKRRAAPRPNRKAFPGLRLGIGDDCAVLAHTRQKDLLVTTDLFLEGVHFRRSWQQPESLGHKALARGLSDIAAMGGTPRFVFLSLGVPRNPVQASGKSAMTGKKWLHDFLSGFFHLAAQSKVVLAGGDTSASAAGLLADVAVVGDVPRGRALLRSGARPGDEIWVSGTLGAAAVGLTALQRGKKPRPLDPAFQAFCYPVPRLRIGSYIRRRKLASAMLDLSDGLSIDLARLCQASGVGAEIDAASLPRLPETPLHNALHGGEDFELLFTLPPTRSRQLPRSLGGVPLSRIGRITSGRNLLLIQGNRKQLLPILGFQHF